MQQPTFRGLQLRWGAQQARISQPQEVRAVATNNSSALLCFSVDTPAFEKFISGGKVSTERS
jgi:hypothetical protein